jgi:uncharacterized protein (TIGR00251 family)
MIALESSADGVVIPVRVRAGARRTGLAGNHDGALRIDVTVAPEKGKANRAVLTVLAALLHVAKSDLEILTGAASSHKRIVVRGITLANARERIVLACGNDH